MYIIKKQFKNSVMEKVFRCAVCLMEYTKEEFNTRNCPNCKTGIQPLLISMDGYFKLNWQDIRVLTIYAQRWAAGFDVRNPINVEYLKALQNILDRVSKYQPQGSNNLDPAMQVVINKEGIVSPYFNKGKSDENNK